MIACEKSPFTKEMVGGERGTSSIRFLAFSMTLLGLAGGGGGFAFLSCEGKKLRRRMPHSSPYNTGPPSPPPRLRSALISFP
jgi:hypothetical protein